MEHPAVERRLAAILAADMVGYSTLHYKRASDRAHHREGLLKAGLAP